MTNKNKETLREGWYWSWNGRDFFVNDGAFPTRGAVADFVNAKSFKGKEKPAKIYLVYGKEVDLKIADYISNIVVRVNEDLLDMQDECGDGPFYCSFDEKISLDKMVKEAADRWQIYNGIRPVYVRFRKDTIQAIPLEPAK